ncbi:MAG: glutathione S-transferase [Rhodobacterales bacterium 65-51]|uniref:glutathione S-transferase family protein n=1 Tax=uncultured Gemmobacter sp. TaxID=1095917 RepID=UPI00095DEAA1|nr:glutathione S-transferase family protein [uncultured Gemmobacter sp.]OJY31982.1 MAG: glutathione S-transferase [Rhodobacterales bacterium 65-51]
MLTLCHAPNSRSSRILTLIEEMGIRDEVALRPVTIRRFDDSGGPDAANPHPEGKVPLLDHDGTLISETAAIMLYLTALFPQGGMAPPPGDPQRGAFLTWLFWYGAVMEPALIVARSGLSHPAFTATWRGTDEVAARISAALARGPWLLGDRYSAVDLLVHSPYAWFREATPDDPAIRDWVARCQARPAVAAMQARDAALMAG